MVIIRIIHRYFPVATISATLVSRTYNIRHAKIPTSPRNWWWTPVLHKGHVHWFKRNRSKLYNGYGFLFMNEFLKVFVFKLIHKKSIQQNRIKANTQQTQQRSKCDQMKINHTKIGLKSSV